MFSRTEELIGFDNFSPIVFNSRSFCIFSNNSFVFVIPVDKSIIEQTPAG